MTGIRRIATVMALAGWSLLPPLSGTQQEPGIEPREVTDGVTPPRIVERRHPQYTDQARRARLAGTVAVEGVLRADGEFEPTRVVQRLPVGLTERALAAMQTWKVEPARFDGQPVAVSYTMTITYSISGQRYLETPLVLVEGGGVDWPEGTAPGSSALLDVTVDPTGAVVRVKALETEKDLGRAVVGAAATWRFEPPDGKRAQFFYTVTSPDP